MVTHIVPTGEDSDGHALYLPEKHIDSPNIAAYPHVKWGHLAVSDAKEDDDTSKSDVYRKPQEAAQTELDNGCDLPTVTLDVDFLSVDDIHDGAIKNAHIENGAVDSAKIADAAIQNAHIAGAAIGSANIVDGAIQSAKIADAAVTRAKIADLTVGSARIADLAVTTAEIA